MENLFVGAIITIPTIAEGANIVISTVECEEKKYALIAPVEGKVNIKKYEINNISFDIAKVFVVSYNKKTEEISYDSNEAIIKELVNKMINRK